MYSIARWQRPFWPYAGRLTDLRNEIDRLFEAPLTELAQASQLLSGWTPPIDVHEDKDNVLVKVELPGMKKEDIDISLHEGCLSVSGERKVSTIENAEVHRAERFEGRFQRTVSLPSAVAAERVTAQYKDGVLTVTLPKTEEAKPRRIDVNVG